VIGPVVPYRYRSGIVNANPTIEYRKVRGIVVVSCFLCGVAVDWIVQATHSYYLVSDHGTDPRKGRFVDAFWLEISLFFWKLRLPKFPPRQAGGKRDIDQNCVSFQGEKRIRDESNVCWEGHSLMDEVDLLSFELSTF
jgi:hypothetical protein